MTQFDAAIIGGGPAGLMAATQAATRGRKTVLLDKNRRPGVKILISGGTRCNLTHDTDARSIVEAFGPNGRFLYSALAALGPKEVVELFEAEGVPTKIEPGGKVFPASDRASDVLDALLSRLRRSGCVLAAQESVVDLKPAPDGFHIATTKRSIEAQKVLLATGGMSYPACGTTGDGYRLASELGHSIVEPHTALVPITSHAPWVLALQGITLPDVSLSVVEPGSKGKKSCLARRRGSLLFTHFGVSGPVVLDVSHVVSGCGNPNSLVLRCDMLPAISEVELDQLLARECTVAGKRRVGTALDAWLPHRLGATIVELAGISPNLPLAELSKTDRSKLACKVKQLDIPAAGAMGFRKAELTAGGVALDQIDSHTMQSRIVPNLFFAGELLDLNGPVGGYNFQAAFSTGWLAGEHL